MSHNAIELLKADHDEVKELLEELTSTTKQATKSRPELLAKIAKELRIHTMIEEEIFYPAFKNAGGTKHNEMNHEALEEHRAVEETVLPDLESSDPSSDEFSARAKVLKEMVEHHAEEEEEEMFPMAKKSLSTKVLEDLGERMMARKEELHAQM